MDKKEYVNLIERSLVGKISPEQLRDIVQYYRDYIDMEIRKGKSEREVLDGLGDPRLLAKTIAMTHGNNDGKNIDTDYGNFREKENRRQSGFHIPLVGLIVIGLLVIIFVVGLLMTALRILLPIFLPVLLLVGLWHFLQNRQR